ncbi:MAG: tRNA (adenosine(37)-N6)-threonylcarbamoyltransferase complex ATPase subunit type 1 TsaE [Panacagrimonas sp.]
MCVELADAEATADLGASLARELLETAGGVLYLIGDLGAGKTTLARGFLRAAGVTGAMRSPTYTLLEPYMARGREFLHLDLYRLNNPSEVEELGLRDYPPERTIWLVEWPDRGKGHLPAPSIVIHLEHTGATRVALIERPTRSIG